MSMPKATLDSSSGGADDSRRDSVEGSGGAAAARRRHSGGIWRLAKKVWRVANTHAFVDAFKKIKVVRLAVIPFFVGIPR